MLSWPKLTLSVSVLTVFFIRKSLSNCDGCDTSQTDNDVTCDFTFVEGAVYGCGGIWQNEGNGIFDAEVICADGYSICDDISYTEELGLTYDLCVGDLSPVTTDLYYLSGVGGDGTYTCTDTGVNDLFGCGTNTTEDWLYINDTVVNCGPFGAAFSIALSNSGRAWRFGWEPYGNDDTELNQVYHDYSQSTSDGSNWARNGEVDGGVLCCKDRNDSTDEPEPIEVNDIYYSWRDRTIYQLLTDRFAVADDAEEVECTDLSDYCGGTFRGIIDKINYIYDLGFNAIWISPIIQNTDGGYHGYWAQDINEINSYFGTESDLQELSTLLHSKDMVLIVDIVCNHMGYQNSADLYDFSGLEPFNDTIYYHRCADDSSITETNNINGCASTSSTCDIVDYNDENEVEICRLAGLPDLNTTNQDVIDIFCDWIVDLIDTYSIDGLRIDTVKHVNFEFWEAFMICVNDMTSDDYNDYTWVTGEYFSGETNLLAPYQSTELFASLLSFPMYYTLSDVFGSRSQTLYSVEDRYQEYQSNFGTDNVWLLAGFVDNHDVNRWLCSSNSYTTGTTGLKNALTFLFTSRNIPTLYYGTEQGLDGCSDPANREALWDTGYHQESDLYTFIQLLNWVRRQYLIFNDNNFNIVSVADTLMIYNINGELLVLLANDVDTETLSVSLDSYLGDLTGGTYCNVLAGDTPGTSSTDCFDSTSGSVTVDISYGMSKIYAYGYTTAHQFENTYNTSMSNDDDSSTSTMTPNDDDDDDDDDGDDSSTTSTMIPNAVMTTIVAAMTTMLSGMGETTQSETTKGDSMSSKTTSDPSMSETTSDNINTMNSETTDTPSKGDQTTSDGPMSGETTDNPSTGETTSGPSMGETTSDNTMDSNSDSNSNDDIMTTMDDGIDMDTTMDIDTKDTTMDPVIDQDSKGFNLKLKIKTIWTILCVLALIIMITVF